ncbi:MAG: hypothetical protein ABH832_04575 [bacterium]
MFYYIRLYLRDLWILIPLILVAVCQLLAWYFVGSNIKPSMEQVFLHYNIVFGVDLVGVWWRIYLLPFGGLFVILLNYAISYYIYKSEKFLARLLAFWALFFNVFLTIAVYLIVRLNI